MRRCLSGAASALKRNVKAQQSVFCREQSTTVTLFPGDGIGPEIAESVKKVYSAAGVNIDWDEQVVGTTADPRTNSMVTRENLDSVLVRTVCNRLTQLYSLELVYHLILVPLSCVVLVETQDWVEGTHGYAYWQRS